MSVYLFSLHTGSKSPYLYYQTISQILINISNDLNSAPINSLARIIGGTYGVTEVPDIKPGLQLALDTIQMANKKNQQQIYNILQNSLHIIKLEKGTTSPYLKKSQFTQAAQECISKFFNIWEALLCKVTLFGMDEVKMGGGGVEVKLENSKKKVKSSDGPTTEVKSDYSILKESVHLLATLLDNLDIYGKNASMNPTDVS
jgi:hypothetical protein